MMGAQERMRALLLKETKNCLLPSRGGGGGLTQYMVRGGRGLKATLLTGANEPETITSTQIRV